MTQAQKPPHTPASISHQADMNHYVENHPMPPPKYLPKYSLNPKPIMARAIVGLFVLLLLFGYGRWTAAVFNHWNDIPISPFHVVARNACLGG